VPHASRLSVRAKEVPFDAERVVRNQQQQQSRSDSIRLAAFVFSVFTASLLALGWSKEQLNLTSLRLQRIENALEMLEKDSLVRNNASFQTVRAIVNSEEAYNASIQRELTLLRDLISTGLVDEKALRENQLVTVQRMLEHKLESTRAILEEKQQSDRVALSKSIDISRVEIFVDIRENFLRYLGGSEFEPLRQKLLEKIGEAEAASAAETQKSLEFEKQAKQVVAEEEEEQAKKKKKKDT